MEMPSNKRLNQTIQLKKNFFETSFWQQQKLVIGIDEVGRGCLAGPLVTAAVVLPLHKTSKLLQDSKILSEDKRQLAYRWIIKHCWYQVGIVHHRIIDTHNIWHATLIAMKRALVNLLPQVPQRPSAILVDAMPLHVDDAGIFDIPVYHFTFGERRSSSIAAASIIAKVTRDTLMNHYDLLFPGYQLAVHKGYATALHQQCLNQEQPLIIHRTSFLRNYRNLKEPHDLHNQQTIC
jgi:ribonuclease HII